ncbi:PDZ domain-containing protein GIPC3 [Morone saxatilis]|uniref:PDZ domain-containing protein GIPC3 n=1 Tax=Morone saxatilis TaxID=34816 RepID=UPI0015E230EF|nr:PDZ domain-containing protein GIPC3 [Morone saxatilis]
MQNGEAMSPQDSKAAGAEAMDEQKAQNQSQNQGCMEPTAPPLPPPSPPPSGPPEYPRPRLIFHTQLAHGSPTGRIHGFTNVKELYAKIAEVFHISPSEVQSKPRMSGQAKPLGSLILLSTLNHTTSTTKGHSLSNPNSHADMIGMRTRAPKSNEGKMVNGKETLRLRSKGAATVQEVQNEFEEQATKKVDDLLESYMGIRDLELATTIVEAGKDKKNPDDFAEALDSVLGDFAFPDVFLFDVWGAIGDVKNGRI